MNPSTSAFLCGIGLEAGFLFFAFQKDWPLRTNLFLALYGALFLLWLAAWKAQTIPLWAILCFAVLFRLTLLPVIPSLSDDIYRYGWEGRIQRAGFSPYRHAPEAPELAPLRDVSWPRINHKNISTVYPTLSQLAFRCGSYLTGAFRVAGFARWKTDDQWLIWTDVAGQKIIFIFFDLATILLVWRLMQHQGVDSRNLILYAWNPLVIIEIAGSGHHDSLGICMLTLGVLAWEKGHLGWAGAGLAASFLSKYLSVLLIPKMILQGNGLLLGTWGALALLGLAMVRPPVILMKGPAAYATNWQFNGSIYVVIQQLCSGNGCIAKIVTAALGGGAMWLIALRQPGISQAAYQSIAVALLLAPTLHPWYFLWLTPFLCLFPNPAFLLWNGTIALSYTVLSRYRTMQVWNLNPAIQMLEYLPVYAWLILQKV